MAYGYKQMLRDRMPLVLDLALRWCKAKNRWVDYVYDNSVKKVSKDKRSVVVKQILGIKQRWKRQEIYDNLRYVELRPVNMEQVNTIPKSKLCMTFIDTIDWQTLSIEDPNMYEYWKSVASWVDWFSKSHLTLQHTYKYWKDWQMSDEEIVGLFMQKYEISSSLAKFLIKSFK